MDTLGKGTRIRGLRIDLKVRLIVGGATLISKVAISLLIEVNYKALKGRRDENAKGVIVYI
jgi:hypothetical protein